MKGYLSPMGYLYPCESYGHLSLATEICESIYDLELGELDSEEYLLKNGFICIRARDMFMSFNARENKNRITEHQFDFFEKNKDKLNDMQIEFLNQMILEQN